MTPFYAVPVVMPAGGAGGGFAYNGLRGLGEDSPKPYSNLVLALDEGGFIVKGVVLGGVAGLIYAMVKDKPLALGALTAVVGGVAAKALYTPPKGA